jgi:hypothetical protein
MKKPRAGSKARGFYRGAALQTKSARGNSREPIYD